MTIADTRIDPDLSNLDGDHERLAHVVNAAELADAMIFGTEIEALCGKRWVPTRDPEKFPVCPECSASLAALP